MFFAACRQQICVAVDPIGKLITTFLILITLTPVLSAQTKEDSKQATALRAQAVGAQNQRDFKFAARTWEKLLLEHPNCSFADDARYQCGVCHFNLGDYRKASGKFDATVKSGGGAKSNPHLEPAYLYLGFSQFQLGEREKGEKSQKLIKTSIATFDNMLKKFPAGKLADQGLLFRGEAYEALKDFKNAAGNYKQIIDNFPSSLFFIESHYRLGYALGRMKNAVESEEMLAKYIEAATANNRKAESDTSVKKIDENRINDARFDIAESIRLRGEAASGDGQNEKANRLFADSQKRFASLAGNSEFKRWDVAAYQSALCLRQQKNFAAAAAAFEKLAENEKSAYTNEAAIQAGRSYFDADELAKADKWFDKMRKSGGRYALEAAHFQTLILMKGKKYEAAASLAKAAMQFGSREKPFYARLQMDYADALYHQPEKRGDSIDVYLEVARAFPKTDLAPQAAYYAAFAAQKNREYDRALQLVKKFMDAFQDSAYKPDVLQVKADSLMQLQKYKEAIAVFDEVIKDFSSHENAGVWQVRRAACQYFNGSADAIQTGLANQIDSIKPASAQALGYYWLGVSQFEKKDWKQAADFVRKSLDVDANHGRAGEATLLLARAQFQQKDTAGAIKTATGGAEKYTEAGMAERFNYRLGEFNYENGNYKTAAGYYVKVVKSGKNRELVPNAYYSLAWSQLKLKQNESAIESFTQLIDRFKDHELVDDAKLGRGMTQRQARKHQAAIDDLTDFVKTSDDAGLKYKARYEIALSQLAMKSIQPAIKNLTGLLEEDSKSKLADRICYELAWAHRDSGKTDESIKYFEKLSKDYEQSPFAAEAFFHLGQADYDDKDYDSAIENYRQCIKRSKNKAHAEKAAYKMAWSQFQQKKYGEAGASFSQQLKDHAEGELAADGYFMVAECLFRQKKHGEAVTAYKAAMPKVLGGKVTRQVKWQTLLHGAQSANKAGKFPEAISFADKLINRQPDDAYVHEANLERGLALKGQKKYSDAIAALEKSAAPLNETGARSYFMIGEIRFEEKKLDEAITAFKKVIYGYGGPQSPDEIKPWQALSAYEAGRCLMVRISATKNTDTRKELVAESKKMFQNVVDNRKAEARLVADAKKQLATLERM